MPSLNFYISRHIFAITVTLLHGFPITSIKKMKGHDRSETKMRYEKTNNSIIGDHMIAALKPYPKRKPQELLCY